jgi:hypothetical protein
LLSTTFEKVPSPGDVVSVSALAVTAVTSDEMY